MLIPVVRPGTGNPIAPRLNCSSVNDWFEEKRMYHRDNGQIVKINDDLMSATRIALMMIRFATLGPRRSDGRRGPKRGTIA